MIYCAVIIAALLCGAPALADSCPYCGRYYPDAAPGDWARVAALRAEHERECRAAHEGSGGGGGGYDYGGGGGSALGDAFGAMLDGFIRGIEQGRLNAQAREAERQQQAELERQRQEELRLERIRRAEEFRAEFDRRADEMRERLEGVFDVVPGGPVESEGPAEDVEPPDVFVGSSVVDLRPEHGERSRIEARERILGAAVDPAFLAAGARRAAETDAFAAANYALALPPPRPEAPKPSMIEPLRGLGKLMQDDAIRETLGAWGRIGDAANRAKAMYTAGSTLARDVLGGLPSAVSAVSTRPDLLDAAAEKYDTAPRTFWETAVGDEHAGRRDYREQFEKIGAAVEARTRGVLTGVKIKLTEAGW